MTTLVYMIKQAEGLRLQSYMDVDGVLTIGYGHTGEDVYLGQTIDEGTADAMLLADIAMARSQVLELCPALTGNQLDAITDFLFNEGYARLAGSTLRKLILQNDYAGVPAELAKWEYGGGKVLQGLVTRRQAEIDLWNLPS